jgi:hypothetical protein
VFSVFFSPLSFLSSSFLQTSNLLRGEPKNPPAKEQLVYIYSLTRFFCHSLTTSSSLHEPDKISFRIFLLLLQDNMFCSYINLFCVAVSLLHFQSLVCGPFSLHSLDYVWSLLWALNDLPLNSVTFLHHFFF